MGSVLVLLLIVVFVNIVENYSPHGDSACSYKAPWSALVPGGTCWRYCSGGSGPWCYTGDYCRDPICSHRSTCTGQPCPADEPQCVEECTCYDPPAKPVPIQHDNVRGAIACEGTSLQLQCNEPPKTINVIIAIYGNIICSHHQVNTTNCSTDATKKVIELCIRKSDCTIEADNSIFGDPCFGTHKYLHVVYNCV